MKDTLEIKRRMAERGHLSKEQAEDIVNALFGEDPLVTGAVLSREIEALETRMSKKVNAAIIKVLLGFVAINGMFLAAAAYF